MSYPRVNTIQAGKAGTDNAAVTLKLPNAGTSTPVVNAIGENQRWRIRFLSASLSATPAAPVALTVTDGVFTYTFDLTGPVVLENIDWQCAPGAEIVVTLAAGGSGKTGHINISAQVEG